MDIDCDIESMEHVIQKEIKKGGIKVFYDLIMVDGLCGKMKWENGILVYNNSFEILLYHLIRYKSNKYLRHTGWKIVPNKFFIDKYIIRTESIFTLTGFMYYCYFTYFRPFFFKLYHLTKYFYSRIFSGKQDICFSKSNYKNVQGHDYILLDGETLKFNGSEDKSRILKSKFEKDVFYIKKLPFLEFRFFSDENDKIFRLQLTQSDGSLINYVLKQ